MVSRQCKKYIKWKINKSSKLKQVNNKYEEYLESWKKKN